VRQKMNLCVVSDGKPSLNDGSGVDGESPTTYVENDVPKNNGGLIERKPLIYECGPLCKCPPTYRNRVS
jgi:hypothetical protein